MRQSHRGPRRAAAVLILAVLTTAGCAHDRARPTAGPSAMASPAAVRTDSDPSTWTLPLLRYQPTPDQEHAMVRAENLLVQRCAAGFGVDWQPDPELPPVGPKNVMDWRYGIHDPVLSGKRGYQTDAAQQARYDKAMRAQQGRPARPVNSDVVLAGTELPPEVLAKAGPEAKQGMVAGRKVPDGGCLGQARRTLGSTTHGVSPLVERLSHDSYPSSMQDPKVKAVFAQWSSCMKAKGFDYAAPMDANDDPRFRPGPQGVGKQEIETALSDIECRTTHRVAEVWHDAEARIQEREIAANAGPLAADREALDTVIRKADQALAGT
ncbi:hypothetical protein [Streptomyces sp. NPDC050485]|uniref:hypothetical protein n=1 Tax=Streptomyces sp. NPDC050485 TaxID=3365617 RepID=UPI00379C914D